VTAAAQSQSPARPGMTARARATIERGAVLRDLVSGPPLTLRRVRSDEEDLCRLCEVGSAAGPLPGDDVGLALWIRSGARVELLAAGALIAQGGPSNGREPQDGWARVTNEVLLEGDAELAAEPAAVVVCNGSQLELTTTLDLAPDSFLSWRELIVLGRSGEPSGSAVLRWRVRRAGRSVLRQTIDLRVGGLSRWPGMLAGGRVLASALVTGPKVRAETSVADQTAVVQRIDAKTALACVLDSDAASADVRLNDLLGRIIA
jgi:urease accessory protein